MKDNAILAVEVKENYHMACIWPAADTSKTAYAVEMLKQMGSIIYSRDIRLNYSGMRNFMIEIYGHQPWIGNIWNHFRGVRQHLDDCYCPGKPVKTYVFSAPSLETVTAVKGEIRKMFGIGNSSIHISDNRSETYDMMQLLYNRNSVDFLNYGQPFRYKNVYRKVKKAAQVMQERYLDKNRLILGPEAAMEVCGLGRASQVDVYTDYPEKMLKETGKRLGITYRTETGTDGVEISELLYEPKNYFYYEGMKVVAPQCVLKGNLFHRERKKEQKMQRFVNRIEEGKR